MGAKYSAINLLETGAVFGLLWFISSKIGGGFFGFVFNVLTAAALLMVILVVMGLLKKSDKPEVKSKAASVKEEQERVCEGCKKPIGAGAQFCKNCGHKVGKSDVVVIINNPETTANADMIGVLSYVVIMASCFLPFYYGIMAFRVRVDVSLLTAMRVEDLGGEFEEAGAALMAFFGVIIVIALAGLIGKLCGVKNSLLVAIPIALLDMIGALTLIAIVVANTQELSGGVTALGLGAGFWLFFTGTCGLTYYLLAGAESKKLRNRRVACYFATIGVLVLLAAIVFLGMITMYTA